MECMDGLEIQQKYKRDKRCSLKRGEPDSKQAQKTTTFDQFFCIRAFARLTVVETSEGLIFGDVGIEELEWGLRDDPVRDDFVVSDDVGEWEGAEAVFSVWFHRVELHPSCWKKKCIKPGHQAKETPGNASLDLCDLPRKKVLCKNTLF